MFKPVFRKKALLSIDGEILRLDLTLLFSRGALERFSWVVVSQKERCKQPLSAKGKNLDTM
jgi:hypothetical protein